MIMQELELPKGWIKPTIGKIVKNKKFAVVDGPFGTQLHVSDFHHFIVLIIFTIYYV